MPTENATDKANTHSQMVISTKVAIITAFVMAKELMFTKMAASILANIKTAKSTAKAPFGIRTDRNMKVNEENCSGDIA
jgi:hypothetical protein